MFFLLVGFLGSWEWGGAVGNGFFDLKGPGKEGGSSFEKK